MSDYQPNRPFTDSVRRVAPSITARAADRSILRIDEESLAPLTLWALIRWERKLAVVALEKMGVDLARLADQLDALLTRIADDHRKLIEPAIQTGAKSVALAVKSANPLEPLFKQAEVESSQMEFTYVGTEHLLLAAISLADSTLEDILREHSISHDRVRELVLQLLGADKEGD